jgi:hypothetical protein
MGQFLWAARRLNWNHLSGPVHAYDQSSSISHIRIPIWNSYFFESARMKLLPRPSTANGLHRAPRVRYD